MERGDVGMGRMRGEKKQVLCALLFHIDVHEH